MHLKAGDKVRMDWRANGDYAVSTATVMDHPLNPDWIIILSDDDANTREDAYVEIYKRDGTTRWGTTRDITLIDPAREAWDALHAELRAHINWLGRAPAHNAWNVDAEGAGQKIRAIKLLRAMTGLGLVEAKRAVESQWP